MGNKLNHLSPAETRAVTVYFDKGRLLQFSSPVPALRLMQENPNHLLVYSVVKAAELNSATQVSRDHVRIRVVHPGDVLQVSRVYFLVHIPEKHPAARSAKHSPSDSESTPSASPRLARSASARLVDSPSSASQRLKHHGASALPIGTVAAPPSASPRPIGSCGRQKTSFATKYPFPKSSAAAAPSSRIDSGSGRLIGSSTQIEKPRNTLRRELQWSPPTPPKPMVPSSPDRPRKSSQHHISNKGRSPYCPVRNSRRSSSRRPVSSSGKPPGSSRQRPIGSPSRPKPHQPRPPGRKTVSDTVSLKEDILCFSCCSRFKEEPRRRPIKPDPSPAPPRQPGGGGRADQPRKPRRPAPSVSWQPRLDSISENSASFSTSNSELSIPNPFFFAKCRPPVHRRRR